MGDWWYAEPDQTMNRCRQWSELAWVAILLAVIRNSLTAAQRQE